MIKKLTQEHLNVLKSKIKSSKPSETHMRISCSTVSKLVKIAEAQQL